MQLTSEAFVLVIFIVGFPFLYSIFRETDIPGRRWFLLAYSSLTLSNFFTVIESLMLHNLFNLCEHIFIMAAAVLILLGCIQLKINRTSATHHYKTDCTP